MSISAAILAVVSLAAGNGPTGDLVMTRPLSLIVEPAGDLVRFRVVGESATPCEARYALDVTANGNHSLQKGSVRLRPGEPVILVTSSIRNGPAWSARLTVSPCSGPSYEQLRTSAD